MMQTSMMSVTYATKQIGDEGGEEVCINYFIPYILYKYIYINIYMWYIQVLRTAGNNCDKLGRNSFAVVESY